MRSTRALGGFWALAAVLAGCAPAPEPPAPAPPAPVVTRYEPPPREEPKPAGQLSL